MREAEISFLPSDGSVLIGMHIALVSLLTLAVCIQVRNRWRSGRGATLSVNRGPQSMSVFTSLFATTLGLFYAAIDVSSAFTGYKSFVLIADFVAIGYLFLFNNWFRNLTLAAALNASKESG